MKRSPEMTTIFGFSFSNDSTYKHNQPPSVAHILLRFIRGLRILPRKYANTLETLKALFLMFIKFIFFL